MKTYAVSYRYSSSANHRLVNFLLKSFVIGSSPLLGPKEYKNPYQNKIMLQLFHHDL